MPKTRAFTLFVFLALFVSGCTGLELAITDATLSVPDQPVGATFATPEEAINAYLDGVAQNDVGKILGASAINEMSQGFRFDRSVERLQAMDLAFSPSPSDYPFYAEINKMQAAADILNGVKWLAYGLLSDEDMEAGLIYPVDAERVARFITDVHPARLSTIKIKQIRLPDETLVKDTRYLEGAATLAAIYGADELTERVVLFSFEGSDYYIGFTLLRYADTWKIKDQASPLAGVNPNGAPQPVSEEGSFP